jgi:hypothetical protein
MGVESDDAGKHGNFLRAIVLRSVLVAVDFTVCVLLLSGKGHSAVACCSSSGGNHAWTVFEMEVGKAYRGNCELMG